MIFAKQNILHPALGTISAAKQYFLNELLLQHRIILCLILRYHSMVNVRFMRVMQMIAVVTISSLGVAGVGGGATFAALIVLSTMNLPVALAGLLISVEPLIDMGRTALNVSGSMTSGVISSKLLKEQNKEVYNQPDRDLDTAEAS